MPAPMLQQGLPAPTLQQGLPTSTLQQGLPASTLQQGLPAPMLQQGLPAPMLQQGPPARHFSKGRLPLHPAHHVMPHFSWSPAMSSMMNWGADNRGEMRRVMAVRVRLGRRGYMTRAHNQSTWPEGSTLGP